LDLKTREKFASIFKSGDIEKLEPFLVDTFSKLANSEHISLKTCQNVCSTLLLLSSHHLEELEIYHKQIHQLEAKFWDQLFKLETLEDMKKQLLQHLSNVMKFVLDEENTNTTGVINQIKSIIQEEFSHTITIQDIANRVYLTPNYLCH